MRRIRNRFRATGLPAGTIVPNDRDILKALEGPVFIPRPPHPGVWIPKPLTTDEVTNGMIAGYPYPDTVLDRRMTRREQATARLPIPEKSADRRRRLIATLRFYKEAA